LSSKFGDGIVCTDMSLTRAQVANRHVNLGGDPGMRLQHNRRCGAALMPTSS
jgi:hypothetical protein